MDITNEFLTRVRKLNIYLIPQYLWLILLYYLMINALYKLFGIMNQDFNFNVPNEILTLNNTILNTIEKWTPFLWFLSIALVFCGLIIAFIQYLPVLESYDFSYRGGIGVYLGSWLLLIVVTIYLFKFLSVFFLVVIPICYGLTKLWENQIKDRFYY
ncbi:hypothetical protein [Oceanobacillus salinisoli]|uniref:hypothetical protein n=1 Tax=Oceanobacillus salinisoli TaxID=2678611 RepID=UPI0012E22185|nr:hypothetical protein [Oceanobacillus salinisoli]